MTQAVLSLCDKTSNMVKPWADAGYECFIVDIQHKGVSREGNITRVGASVTEYLPPLRDWKIAFAFPPCTHLAVSGAAHFKKKGLGKLIEALTLVEYSRRTLEMLECPWMLENPVGTLSTYWRKPNYLFNPCDYGGYLPNGGDAYTKKTCLWTGNGFVMPKMKPVEPTEGSKMNKLPPSKDRADLRSITPMGFARAVYEANKD